MDGLDMVVLQCDRVGLGGYYEQRVAMKPVLGAVLRHARMGRWGSPPVTQPALMASDNAIRTDSWFLARRSRILRVIIILQCEITQTKPYPDTRIGHWGMSSIGHTYPLLVASGSCQAPNASPLGLIPKTTLALLTRPDAHSDPGHIAIAGSLANRVFSAVAW